MSDYLMRGAAPIAPELWAKVDGMVVQVMKSVLVGRRLMELVGPLGWGVEMAPLFGFDAAANVASEAVHYAPLKELRQEFTLRAKHMAIAEQTSFGLDLGAVAIAATKLAKAEDDLVIGGLVKAAGSAGALGDWNTPGSPFAAIAEATAKLLAGGYDAPYALVLCPDNYAKLASLVKDGIREIEMVEKLVRGGIFQCPGLDCGQVLVLSLAAWNFDLVVGQDAVTGYIGNAGLDQQFRIFETLALRVKRPGAICVLK
jgi:uncharacterized linocin/CFP29 family protein